MGFTAQNYKILSKLRIPNSRSSIKYSTPQINDRLFNTRVSNNKNRVEALLVKKIAKIFQNIYYVWFKKEFTFVMTRTSLIIVIVGLTLLGILFFVSGYNAATGLIHAQLPKASSMQRSPSIDTSTLLASQAINTIELPGAENAREKLNSLFFNKIDRIPSPDINEKKKNALIPQKKVLNHAPSQRIYDHMAPVNQNPQYYVLD